MLLTSQCSTPYVCGVNVVVVYDEVSKEVARKGDVVVGGDVSAGINWELGCGWN